MPMKTDFSKQTVILADDPDLPYLDRAIAVTKQTPPEQVKQLVQSLAQHAMDGTLQWQNNVSASLRAAIEHIDQLLSKQLSALLATPSFAELEGRWRGLHYLVKNSLTNQQFKIKLLNLSKKDLQQDLSKAVEFDQSELFKKIYETEYGSPGGEPYGLLLGDYYFNHQPQDIALLRNISQVAAASFAPFISAADATLFGFDDWTDLSQPRDLEKIFASQDYIPWRSFRDSDDSRFLALTLPRVLSRLPYGNATLPVEAFHFEEIHDQPQYCWMNAAYALAERIGNAFSEYGWCTAIRGAEGGGKITQLPLHTFASDNGDLHTQCPTEIGITDRREAELSKLGFLPLCHYRNTDYAVFFGGESTQRAKTYDNTAATANAKISARLPYIMASSRFAHYMKVMARDKVGAFMEAPELEQWLNHWILQYVNNNKTSKQALKAKYPLAAAKVSVDAIPGQPGSYQAVAWLRPWLQMEELTASIRLVANLPKKSIG